MGRYRIYYSTRPHISEYEDYLENPNNYNEFNKPKEPVKIKLIRGIDREKLYNEVEEKLKNHEISKEEARRLYLEKRNDHLEESFNKYEIDAFLSGFKSEQDCINQLTNPGSMCHKEILEASKNGRQNRILVTYRHNKKTKELTPIYDNKTFQKIANKMATGKYNGDSDNSISIDNIEEDYYAYIEKIKDYIKDRTNCISLIKIFEKSAQYNKMDKQFITSIRSYQETYTAYEDHIERDDQGDMNDINEELEACTQDFIKIMQDYDTFRKVALWEQDLKQKELAEQKEAETEEFIQKEFNINEMFEEDPIKSQEIMELEEKKALIKEIEEVAIIAEEDATKKGNVPAAGARRVLLKTYNSRELGFMPKEFLDKYKINIEKLEEKEKREERAEYREEKEILKEYENDKIYAYYNEGGTAAVIEKMSIDELVNYPKVVLEDVGINVDGLGIDGDPITDEDEKHK